MYWYTFADGENQLAREQAAAQCDEGDEAGKHRKTVGNLGEIAFAEFCSAYLPSDVWEWENREAIKNARPEGNAYDFWIAASSVDVKATTQTKNLHPMSWLMGYDLSDDSNFYVFIQITDQRDKAVIFGWATYRDLTNSARTSNVEGFEHFSLRKMYDLFSLLNITPQ